MLTTQEKALERKLQKLTHRKDLYLQKYRDHSGYSLLESHTGNVLAYDLTIDNIQEIVQDGRV